jgi:cytochrome c556
MRVRVSMVAVLMAWSGVLVVGQATKVSTPEDLSKVMKKVGPASTAIQKAVPTNNVAEIRTQLAILKQSFTDAENFWVEHKREDAIKFNKDAVAKVEAFQKLVATDTVDPTVLAATQRDLGTSCRPCHMAYRAQDANNNYIIKPGSLGGGGTH